MHACADDARSTKILLVMEYIEGGPVVLTSGSQRRHLSEAIARKFFRDALQVSAQVPISPASVRRVQAAAVLYIFMSARDESVFLAAPACMSALLSSQDFCVMLGAGK